MVVSWSSCWWWLWRRLVPDRFRSPGPVPTTERRRRAERLHRTAVVLLAVALAVALAAAGGCSLVVHTVRVPELVVVGAHLGSVRLAPGVLLRTSLVVAVGVGVVGAAGPLVPTTIPPSCP